jgi:hypothetical protein
MHQAILTAASNGSGGAATGLFIWAAIYVGAVIAAVKIGNRKNRNGWPYGLLLGWLGVIILALRSTEGAPAPAPVNPELMDALRELQERRAADVPAEQRA